MKWQLLKFILKNVHGEKFSLQCEELVPFRVVQVDEFLSEFNSSSIYVFGISPSECKHFFVYKSLPKAACVNIEVFKF